MMQKIKNNLGVIFSVLLHLLLLLSAVRIFDRDRYDMNEYQRTQTKGYTVQLVQQPNQPVSPPPSQVVPNTNPGGSPDKILNTKEQINFKDNSEELAKEALAKAAAEKAKEAAKLAKEKEHKEEHEKRLAEIKKERAIEKSLPDKGEKIAQVKKEVIVAASAPIVDYTKEGAGDKIDASTDGNGTKTAAFDLRRVEYGRAAAYAIRQNIVPPPGYEGTVLPYRAFVTLDENMQFVKMQVVQSTGDPQFDINIAKALRETIYPPLPPGADWHYYHNIDFTIH
jgi:hypothetical protein